MSAPRKDPADLAVALREAQRAPDRAELWDKVEELASAAQKPEEAADGYRKALKLSKPPELVMALGQRAVRFHEEWFGAQDDALGTILERMLEADPAADWTVRRATVLYTVKEKWADLLGVYDRALGAVDELGRRKELLSEATNVAKDFAGDIDRAIGYLQQLCKLTPADAHVASQLSRLLERQGRWADLIDLLRTRLDLVPPAESLLTRLRIATLALEHLGDAGLALDEIKMVLADIEDDREPLAILEKVLRRKDAPVPVRRQALTLIRGRYESTGRGALIVPALQAALSFATADEQVDLHREAGDRLAAQGDHAGAMAAFVVLMGIDPSSTEVQERLRHLCELQNDFTLYAKGLTAAAEAAGDPARRVELWFEAARVHETELRDARTALGFHRRAHGEKGAEPSLRLPATRRLAELLGRLPDAEEHPGEQLAALDELASLLATLAPDGAERRAVLGQLARLADRAGDVDRAVAAWHRRLDLDGADREAIDALVDLLDRTARWDLLVHALRRRIGTLGADPQRRGDLVRIARIQATDLLAEASAIDTWIEVQKTFGADVESVDALTELLSRAGRWADLAELLSEAGNRDRSRLAAHFARVGDALVEKLADPARAVDWYRQALEADPAHEGARTGLRTLLADATCRAGAVAALLWAYERTGDWRAALELVEHRLALAANDEARALILEETARVQEQRAADPVAALDTLARAFPLVPEFVTIERDILRLAEKIPAWPRAALALRSAADRLSTETFRIAHLRFGEGAILEARLGDNAGALEAYRAAFILDPAHSPLREAVVRLAARLGHWNVAAEAMLAAPVSRDLLEQKLVPLVEQLALEANAFDALAGAVSAAVTAVGDGNRVLEATLARDLEARVAIWHESHGVGSRPERARAAEAALQRAGRHAVRSHGVAAEAGRIEVAESALLRRLVDVQRQAPGRALYDSLVELADGNPGDLDSLYEAARLALGILASDGLAESVLSRLLDRASRLLRAGVAAQGESVPEATALWAIEEMVNLLLARPDRAAWVRAIDLLFDGTRLPLPADAVRSLRRRAAEIASDKLRDRKSAIQIYRKILEEDFTDDELLARLAQQYQEDNRLPDLLTLRHEELGRATSVERRLALRLDIERIAAGLEEKSNRVDILRANLEEQPGHEATIDKLSGVLEAKVRHAELAGILDDQARRLQERGDSAGAARMWARLAVLAEQPLGDRDRAIACYEKVAAIEPLPAALEALGRLYLDKGEALVAAGWLEKCLAVVAAGVRVEVSLKLAHAYQKAERRQRAVACLERALIDAPAAVTLRAQLGELYRADQGWEPLAKLLSDGCEHVTDPATVLAYAREAQDIYRGKLRAPERALPALERAVVLAPADQGLRLGLAESLLAAGKLERAREVLQALLTEAGRRRSRERAAVHHLLARVSVAQGDRREALDHLEQASGMDMDSAAMLETLAEVAAEVGEADRAERAYRALILLVRREGSTSALSPSEVLLRLRKLALDRGQSDKAQDLLDTAVAGALADPAEAERFKTALAARGELDLSRSVLERRLAATTDPLEQAAVLSEVAEVCLAQGKPEQALDALLKALDKAPERLATHEQARKLAGELGQADRYLTALQALVEHRRRWGDAKVMCRLLTVAGEVAEHDLKDLASAADFLGRAAQVGAEGGLAVAGAAVALVRVARARDDAGEIAKALKLLGRLAAEADEPELRTEAVFRLAEAQLAASDTRDQGLATLSRALEQSPDLDRAWNLVKEANVPEAELPKVMPLYEKVARASSDDRMLLDFLLRRAALPQVTPDEVKEGVDLALALNDTARAETLLVRAVELAKKKRGGLKQVDWALLELARMRKAAGDLEGAVAWLEQAQEVADPTRVLRIFHELADDVKKSGVHPAVPARIYERLWEQNPTDRNHWEPLIDFYAQLGDAAGVARVAAQTVEKLLDPAERNTVRMARAKFLHGADPADAKVADVLRDVLLDEPTHRDAIALLADHFDRTGNQAELDELLGREIEAARQRHDVPALVMLSLKLGARLAAAQPADAREVYRKALLAAPDSVELLRAALAALPADQDPKERAVLVERLLAQETGDTASALAMDLADLWSSLDDDERTRGALQTGMQRTPGSRALFERLCDFYRERKAWAPLATLLADEAGRAQEPTAAVALLREAASLERDNLNNSARGLELLRQAREVAPRSLELLREVLSSLIALGERTVAMGEIVAALASDVDPMTRAELLCLRAELHEAHADFGAAVADLEEASGAAHDEVHPMLMATLGRWRAHAASRHDADGERKALFRVVELQAEYGAADEARALLADWAWRNPTDREALRLLRERDEAAGRWEEVLAGCLKLLQIETGDEQLAVAEALVAAADKVGRPSEAIPGLEAVLQRQPHSDALAQRLMKLYELAGENRKLAQLVLASVDRTSDYGERFQLYRRAGILLHNDGEAELALEPIKQALMLDPNDRDTNLLLADVFLAAGRLDDAAAMLESLMKKFGKDMASAELSDLQHKLSKLSAARGDQRGQLEWLKKALETNRKNALVAGELADLAEALDEHDLAVKALRALTMMPAGGPMTPAMAYFRQARIAHKTGDRSRAIIFAKRALQEDAQLVLAQDFLREVGERRA